MFTMLCFSRPQPLQLFRYYFGTRLPHGGLSDYARAMMLFDANEKTILVAYLLWVFRGLLGGHNFYLR
jgi:TM2 domain